jgi:hypothetical protein
MKQLQGQPLMFTPAPTQQQPAIPFGCNHRREEGTSTIADPEQHQLSRGKDTSASNVLEVHVAAHCCHLYASKPLPGLGSTEEGMGALSRNGGHAAPTAEQQADKTQREAYPTEMNTRCEDVKAEAIGGNKKPVEALRSWLEGITASLHKSTSQREACSPMLFK